MCARRPDRIQVVCRPVLSRSTPLATSLCEEGANLQSRCHLARCLEGLGEHGQTNKGQFLAQIDERMILPGAGLKSDVCARRQTRPDSRGTCQKLASENKIQNGSYKPISQKCLSYLGINPTNLFPFHATVNSNFDAYRSLQEYIGRSGSPPFP